MPSIVRLAAALALLAGLPCGQAATLPPADLVIAGGHVHDGSGAPAVVGDVVIAGDRVIAVGPAAGRRYAATRTIDATGRIVAPGFIDPHTHPYTYLRSADARIRRNAPWQYQGVTTIAHGVDGGGTPEVERERTAFEQAGIGTNLVPYVGFGPVRRAVLGDAARAPDADELARMRALVAQGMCEGAFGFSTGLFYAPQRFASQAEVVALAREAARRGGLYDTHQRDESSYDIGLLASTREALAIGREAGLPVHIAHLKALGSDVHGQAPALVALIEQARAEGQRVTADQYPWLASSTGITAALLPGWAVDGGDRALLQRLQAPEARARIRAAMADNLRRRGGAEALLLISAGQEWTGRTLAQMAGQWRIDPLDAALRIIEHGIHHPGRSGAVASFNMDDDDVQLLMRQPWMVTSSDGSDGHPRQYASFPQKYQRYVRELGVLSTEAFIHRSTALTARILGLEQRGELQPGFFADVVVFDPRHYLPHADYLHPSELSSGIALLVVNGRIAIEDDVQTEVLAGRVLRHSPPAGTCP
ncbi:N-acyl-D-amino-acid deacylase family protein [Stenotrophomonas mori]|uniref:Amidohydrolase family protein n=1 Tax=Stenotrophomonas mori TaxID=2871096 RepID=A0ABT0SJY9_9GAMM|nr:amidohydrolase family protein [Stenotrophomonas mori]MCL7715649.1 amidohydrolase family protein [Stenotrophomonas mori]